VSAQLREKTLVLERTIAALEAQSATEARRTADLIGRSTFLKQKAKECVD
jgi:BMFP domain-containing protein YqiC